MPNVKLKQKKLDFVMFFNFDDDENSQGYGQTKDFCRALTKDDFLKSYTSDHDFRSTNVNDAGEEKMTKLLIIFYTFSIYNIKKN